MIHSNYKFLAEIKIDNASISSLVDVLVVLIKKKQAKVRDIKSIFNECQKKIT